MNKKTVLTLIIIVIAACLVLFVGCVQAANTRPATQSVSASKTLDAPLYLGSDQDAVKVTYQNFLQPASKPAGNRVTTAAEFVYMMKDLTATTYTLGNDFYVSALMWEALGDYTTERKITIKGGYSETITVNGEQITTEKMHRITYAPNLDADEAVPSTSQYGGLFAQFRGSMEKVEYVFRGRIDANMSSMSASIVYYGGLAGKLIDAYFDRCTLVFSGTLNVYANKSGCTIYAGGLAGFYDGTTISDCTVTLGGSVAASSVYGDDTDNLATRSNKLYAGGLAAVCLNNAIISNSVVKAQSSVSTSDGATDKDKKNYNNDTYVLPAGGMFGIGGRLTMTGCELTVGGRVNASGSQYTSQNGVIAGGMFGITGSFSEGGSAASSYLNVTNNIITLSCSVSAITNREHKDSQLFGLIGEDANGGSTYHGGIVGKFNAALDHNSRFENNAILYYATIKESVKYCPTDGHSFYGYLSSNAPEYFFSWNKGNIWTVLEGDEETTNIDVRQSSTESGGVSNDCGDIGVLMVFGGGRIKAEIETVGGSSRLQFSAEQVYSPFDNWYANLTEPKEYAKSAGYHSGEILTEEKEDVNGDPYTKYIFRPSGGGKTVYCVFLTKEIKDAGTFVQWTEEMNSGLNKPWIVVDVTQDVVVTKGVNIVKTFAGKFYGHDYTITFQNGVQMVAVDNLTAEEMTTYCGPVPEGEGDNAAKGAAAGIFRMIAAGAVVRDVNLVFAGKMYGGTYGTAKPVEYYAIGGFLAGINNGTIQNVNLTVPQAGNLVVTSSQQSTAGGLVGVDNGTIQNVTASIQGNYAVRASRPIIGGVVGIANTTGTKTYANFNVDIKGQLECNGSSAIVAGFVGICSGKLSLDHVIVNVHDKSNMGGDVLVNTCSHNLETYADLLSYVENFSVMSGYASVEGGATVYIDEIESEVEDLGVGTVSADALVKLKENVAFVKNKLAAGDKGNWEDPVLGPVPAQYWFDRNVTELTKSLDCNAPCAACRASAVRAVFCANLNNIGFAQVWVIGSYGQYAGDDTYGQGTNYIPYYITAESSSQTVQQAKDVNINMIFVRSGTAEGSFADVLHFNVPVEDSAHVFTGWYTDYNHTEMVSSTLLNGNTFTPGDQAGGVWYSRVINSMITTTEELTVLSTTTNAGQAYRGVTFTLGCDVSAASDFTPIGTEAHPFHGTFDGKGYTVVVNGLDITREAVGFFGCVGNEGVVKQLKVRINSLSNLNGKVFGAVAAINYGSVGQNSQNERVTGIISCTVTGGAIVGGVVGKNMSGGVVQNTETEIVGIVIGHNNVQGRLTASNPGDGAFTAVGGAVGHNDGIVKNVKVSCNIGDPDEYEFSVSAINEAGAAYAGGLIGYNVSELHSGVVEVFKDEQGVSISYARANSVQNAHAAILIGYNYSNDVDGLWVSYQLDTLGFMTPADNALINGVSDSVGNRLVRYGYGSVSVEIDANGSIYFSSATDPDLKVPFYSYTHSLERGEQVIEASGTYYTPVAGTEGVTYYAVFADAEINTDLEYYNLVDLINKGFRAYVNYIVRLKSGTALVLHANDPRYASLGADDNVFVGSFDGSGVVIELKSKDQVDYDAVPMFGTIGATSEVCNFSFTVEPTLTFRARYTYGEDSVIGGMAYVNLGVIRNIVFRFQSGVYGDVSTQTGTPVTGGYATYAGALVGYNAGHIVNSTIALNTGNVGGVNKAARMFALYAGGVAGYNAPEGWIGSSAISSVILALNTDTLPASVVGVMGAGALVGRNDGTVANAAATVRGIVGAPKPADDKFDMGIAATNPAVGGLVGVNRGTVYGSRANITSSAVLRFEGGYLGGIAGTNEGGTLGDSTGATSLTVYWQRAVSAGDVSYFGGVVAYNTGDVRGATVYFEADGNYKDEPTPMGPATYVGGVVGYNAGYVSTVTVSVHKKVALSASATGYLGGAIAYNTGRADACAITVSGYLGNETSGTVGGFAGYTEGVVSNSYVVLYNKVNAAGDKGLAVGRTDGAYVGEDPKLYGTNAWAVAFNSDRTLASNASADSGFNVLKIVGTEMVVPSLVKYTTRTSVRFTSNVTTGLVWYTDISNLEKDTTSSTVFTPDGSLANCLYHLCVYDLEIDTVADLVNIYTFVNSADLFNGVMFKLINNIVVPNGTNLQPIGSLAYPFTGIFEGDGHTITFEAGSVVVGSQLSGLFGSIAEGAVVRNFVMQVDEDVLIGSTTDYVGALAGHIYGSVSDVAINLVSSPRSSKEGAKVGALAGYVGESAQFANVWVISYNGKVAEPVGEDHSTGAYNAIDVYGRGIMRVVRRDSEWQYSRVMQFDISVIEGVDYFDNWYADFKHSTDFGMVSGLGESRVSQENGVVVSAFYRPNVTLTRSRFTASFIKMVIESEQDFYNFADNINTYGVKDGQFRFNLGRNVISLTIDLSKMQPIGTAAHPFQATLDGTVTAFANPDSQAYTLILKGAVQNADYSGLFGYIGEGAVIRNLVVRADNNEAQSIGYRESIYTGFFAGYIQGSAAYPVTLESLVVGVNRNTTLVNSHADAIGGIAGLWGNYVNVTNTWVVLPENGAYQALGSCRTVDGIKQYTETFTDTYDVDLPNTMYLCGEGLINYKHNATSTVGLCTITFRLTSSEKYPFGFIEKLKDMDLDQANLPHEMTATTTDGKLGKVYLALYIKTTVDSEADLRYIADLVNVQNRSYLGVTFTLTRDITLSETEWTPIGGAVETSVGSGEYKQVAFIGAFDGQGYTITMPEGLTCNGQYAGLFGILSSYARIRNLRVVCNAAIGSSSGQYAGVLAGIDQGAALKNIIVDIGQTATLTANMSTSRVAVNRALVYDVNGNVTNYDTVRKAENVWVLNRNSRFSAEHNADEQAFYDTVGTTWKGVYNGGVNVVTVIANGTVDMSFNKVGSSIVGVVIRNAASVVKPIRMWYTLPGDVITPYAPLYEGGVYANEFITDAESAVQGLILYASFLNEFITTREDLVALAVDVGEGCDLYGLTFYLMADVTVDAAAIEGGFIAIGTEHTPFSATFDGQGHAITLAEDVTIEGKVAGIFGVLGEYGVICNLKLDLLGTIGRADYTETEIEAGKVNTYYAGAVAISYGTLDSVIIDATRLRVNALQYGYAAASIAYDYSNYYTNTWLIVAADNVITYFGKVDSDTDSTVNVMRVIGMGRLASDFRVESDQYYVRFSNDQTFTQTIDSVVYSYTIRGWYSDFAGDNQLSQALNVTALDTGVTAGDSGVYLAASDIFSSRFEVAIISRVIVSEADLIAISQDVNEGGYTFENTIFTLGHDVTIVSTDFRSIGTSTTPFLGTFQGAYNGNFYKIVLSRKSFAANGQPSDAGVALFGVMRGVVENLIVELTVDVPTYNSVTGVIAQYNYGTVRNSLVRLYRFSSGYAQPVTVYGTTVGGIAGYNAGTVSNCIVYVSPLSTLFATYSVGGLVGQNEGVVMGSTYEQFTDWQENPVAYDTLKPWYDSFDVSVAEVITLSNVLLDGTVKTVNNISSETLFAGGAVGESRNRATVNRITVRIASTGVVTATGADLEVGGLAGRSLATMANSVLISRGVVTYEGTPSKVYSGYFIGNLQGSAPNCWLVTPIPPTVNAIGNGSSVNVLRINGNGFIDAYIDGSNNIIFRAPIKGAALDGWYVNSGIQVPDDVGGVDANSFRPNRNITGYTVNVIFINTEIYTVEDLAAMATTVNAGLFSTGLTFTLMNDLTIDVATSPLFRTLTIGTLEGENTNAFKHVFEGNGFTITVLNSANDVSGDAYVGLFGYTGQDAVIRNLDVVVKSGTYGRAGITQALGTLVAVNYGTIEQCNVYLGCYEGDTDLVVVDVPTRFIAAKVGGVAGENFGTVTQCKVTSYGALQAETGATNATANLYAGGVVGNNRGSVNYVDVYLNQPAGGYRAMYAVTSSGTSGTSYVGGVAGNNAIDVSNVYIEINAVTIESRSIVQAYAGGICGSNTGFIKNSYVAWDHVTMISDNAAGGIVGTNNNNLASILIDYAEGSSLTSGMDSAVASTGNYGVAVNVWVFNRNALLNSRSVAVNNATSGTAALEHNEAMDIRGDGRIYFDAAIDAMSGLTVYADADTAYKSVRLDDFITYNGNKLRLTTQVNMAGVHVRSEIRNTIGDQTELKAIAKALAEDGQVIRDDYYLTADVTVDGDYRVIGTEARPFTATLRGEMHRVVFAADVNFTSARSMFGVMAGTINGLVIEYRCDMSLDGSAGIAVTNNGYITDVVVYTADGVTLRNPTYAGGTPASANGEVWIVSRESLSASSVTTTNRYGVIVVNGNGTLDVTRDNGTLFFTARPLSDITAFAGYSNVTTMLKNVGVESNRALFNVNTAVTNNNTMSYTAEFLSTEIANSADFEDLLGLLNKQYVVDADTTFYLVDNITVDSMGLARFATFTGVLDGNFHTLKVAVGLGDDGDKAFATFSGVMQNIVIDSTDLEGDRYLFADSASARLVRVVVRRSGVYGHLQNPGTANLRYQTVYVVSPDAACTHAASVGLIVETDVAVSFSMGERFMQAVAGEEEGLYFVGWYTLDGVTHFKDATLMLNSTTSYMSRYLSREIGAAADITALAEAVSRGYDFANHDFIITADVTYAGTAVGTADVNAAGNFFAGTIDGNGHTVTAAQPLFTKFAGTLRNIKVATSGEAGFASLANGALQNVVVVSSSANPHFATTIGARLTDCWLVATSATPTPVAGVRSIRLGEHVSLSVDLTEMTFTATPTSSEYFLLWRDKDGAVLDNRDYNVLSSSKAYRLLSSDKVTDGYYFVEGVYDVSTDDEYAYFAMATAHGYKSEAKLQSDINVYATTPAMTDVFKLDGNGHTVYVHAAVALSVLTARSGENTHIYNTVFEVSDAVNAFMLTRAEAGVTDQCAFKNVVVKASADVDLSTDSVFAGDSNVNVWLMLKGEMRSAADLTTDYAALPAGLNVLLYEKGDLSVNYTRTGNNITGVTASPVANDALHFLGIHDTANHTESTYALTGADKRVQAFFANKVISSTAAWTHAAQAMLWSGNHTPDFTLAADVTADAAFVPFADYEGALDGAFYSVVVKPTAVLYDDPAYAGVVALAAGGSVSHLAVEVERGYAAADTTHIWFGSAVGTVTDCVLVNYTDKALSHAAGVRMITVVDQGMGEGYIRVDKRTVGEVDRFAFNAVNTAEYSLRYYEMDAVDYDVDDPDKMAVVFAADETRDLNAKFYYCYTVYIAIEGAPAELVTAQHVTQNTPYWLGFGYTEPKVEFKKVVQGYLFAGFTYPDSAAPAIDSATYTSLSINVANLSATGSITVTAHFVLIDSDWSEITYGDKTLAQIDEYLVPNQVVRDVLATDAAFNYVRQDTPDSNVMSDTDTPYHAGGYVIRFNVYHGGVLVGRSDGLTFKITPRELYFENLRVGVKKYDGNATAKIEYAKLGGFAQADIDKGCRSQYSFKDGDVDTVRLEYFDYATGEAMSNAGTWALRVIEGSYITTTVLNGNVLFNDDYVLPSGALYIYAETADGYVKTDNRYAAIISKQELALVVSDISIEYLDQFGSRDANGTLVPFDIYDYLTFDWSGDIYGDDYGVLSDNTQKAKLLRIVGDRTIIGKDETGKQTVTYSYTIRNVGSYSIEVIKDVLANYEPKISENKATFTIKPSPAAVTLKPISLQYGDMLTSLDYEVQVGGAVTWFTDEEIATLAAANVYTNLTAAGRNSWFAMTLVPEYAIADGNTIAFNVAPYGGTEGAKLGVQYRFTADNKNFTLADTVEATMVINDKNQKEYVLTQDGVLTITQRHIIYNVTSELNKAFGAEDTAISGRTIGKTLMNGDKLQFRRTRVRVDEEGNQIANEAAVNANGELVGVYAIEVSVVDKDGKNVTGNYVLTAYNDTRFTYAITRRTVVVQRTGNGVFSYGSEELQNMPFTTNLSYEVKRNILGALGISLTFDKAFVISVGYFDSTTQPVGKYANATLEVSYGKNVNKALASECMTFVLDEKSASYEIIRAGLTVSAVEVTRTYDMTDNLSGAKVRVTGWANNDGNRLDVRVGGYVCEGLSAVAGTYFYEPTDLTIYAKGSNTALIDNYVIATVVGAKYIIKRSTVTLDIKVGTYDADGNFTAGDGAVPFGDKSVRWNFALPKDSSGNEMPVADVLPDYMAEAYSDADLQTDLERSEWLRQHLAIVARNLASLPAGTIMAQEWGNYLPYSADSNVTIGITTDSYFSVEEVAIVITNVKFSADSAKTEPTMSFTVAAYSQFVRNADGTITTVGNPIEGYFDETSLANVRSDQRVVLNDNYAVSFSFTAYDVRQCTYNLSSYVNDGTTWVTYRETDANPILFVEQADEAGQEVLMSYNRDLTDEVNVKEGVWASIAAAIVEHPAYLAIALVAVLALAALCVVASLLYKRRRIFAKVQREMRNQDIVNRLQAAEANAPETDVLPEAPADGEDAQ